jgi:hypothetical protein
MNLEYNPEEASKAIAGLKSRISESIHFYKFIIF